MDVLVDGGHARFQRNLAFVCLPLLANLANNDVRQLSRIVQVRTNQECTLTR